MKSKDIRNNNTVNITAIFGRGNDSNQLYLHCGCNYRTIWYLRLYVCFVLYSMYCYEIK